MKDLFVTYQSEIVTAAISFAVALITTLLTHLLGNFKLRYTEKLKIASELSKRKYKEWLWVSFFVQFALFFMLMN